MRTSSEPARASSADCRAVPSMSAVSVLVIDCTTMGASPPMVMPPTATATDFLRDFKLVITVPLSLTHAGLQSSTASSAAMPHDGGKHCDYEKHGQHQDDRRSARRIERDRQEQPERHRQHAEDRREY